MSSFVHSYNYVTCSFFAIVVVNRVLELVGESAAFPGQHPIVDAESLYEVAAAVPWSRYMSPDQTLSVDAILGVVPDGLTHSHFTALTVKVRDIAHVGL